MAGIDSFTKLLLHMDGTNGSTTFVDSELTPKSVTANGDAMTISTVQSKFGGASGLFGGSTDYLGVPDSSDFDFGAVSGNDNDFTIDFWVYFNSLAAGQGFVKQAQQGTALGWALMWELNTLYFLINANANVSAAWTPSTGQWYHVAVVRNGSVYTFYVNGTSIGGGTLGTTITNSAQELRIGIGITYSAGNWALETLYNLNGYMDELRISKGIARYTSNFTPESSAYSQSNNAACGSLSMMGVG